MPKFSSYIKALIPTSTEDKSIKIPARFNNLLSISPKDQFEIASQIIPKVGSNNWQSVNQVDLDYLQKLYDCHDLVHSCIDLVSSTFALAKLKVKAFDEKTQKHKYAPNHPLQVLLDNPNNTMSGYDLRQAYIVHRLLFGTMAGILIRNSMMISNDEANRCPKCLKLERDEDCVHILWHFNTGPITQILPVNLQRLAQETIETPKGKRTYFVYDFGNGVKTLVHPNNIMTDPKYNPGGSFHGSSPTDKVKRWLEIDLGMSKQIGAYLANNAIPSMILNLKPPKVTEGGARIEDPTNLLKMIEEKWMKDFSLGSYDQGYNAKPKKPAFTYGDMELLKIQDGIKDIVQKELFFEIQDRIARAYKVPRSFFEFGVKSGVNNKAENEDFYHFAISPELVSFKHKIERYIIPSFQEQGLKVEWDLSSMGIAYFLENNKEAKTLQRWEIGAITLDETRESLGLDPFHDPIQGNDRYRISVMSDGSGSPQENPLRDNRYISNPQLARDANITADDNDEL